jgi:negative regulator of sigma E activity
MKAAWLAATALASAACVLAGVNIGLGSMNRSAQADLARLQNFNAQTPQIQRLVQVVATAVAEAAQRDNDKPLRDLLASNGITVTVNAGAKP